MAISFEDDMCPRDSQGNEIPFDQLDQLSGVDLLLYKRIDDLRTFYAERLFNVVGNNLGDRPFIYLTREFNTSKSHYTSQSLNSRIPAPWHVYLGVNLDDRVDNWEAIADITYVDDGIIFGLAYGLEKTLATIGGIG